MAILLKISLTAAALGVTAQPSLGKKVSKHKDVPAESGTRLNAAPPHEVAAAQRQLSVLQWAAPGLTAAPVVVSAFAGEQQRATEVHKRVLGRALR
jgi:hypothetical protein